MFQGIINRAQRSVKALVSTYMLRMAVAVPFIVSLGFMTAAAVVWLTREYGSLTAYAVLACFFALAGAVAMAVIAISSADTEVPIASQAANQQSIDPAKTSTFDPDLIFTALGAVGPMAIPAVLRLLGRNLPLLVGVLVLAYLLLSESEKSRVNPVNQPV